MVAVCKYENAPFELGWTFNRLKTAGFGATSFQNGVMVGIFRSGNFMRLGCAERSCPNNCRTVEGFSACKLLAETIIS